MRDRVEYTKLRRGHGDSDEETGMEMTERSKVADGDASLEGKGGSKEATVVFIADPEGKDRSKATAKAKGADKPASAKRGGRGTIVFLNGLRGLAALMVVQQHAKYTPGIRLGSCSVDVFFVLSAFLLTMLFEHKARQMLAKKATTKQWGLMLADYFSKRFFRVYPLVVVVTLILTFFSNTSREHYFEMPTHDEHREYNVLKVITFETKSRFFVLWTLPIEIAYYFIIPVFVAAILALRQRWWMLALPLYAWIIYEGIHVRRWHHQPLRPHLPTFVAGSLAAIIYSKANQYIEATNFEFKLWQRVVIRVVELFTLVLFLSLVFRGLLFHGYIKNPYMGAEGFPFTSVTVSALIVIEMLLPSALSRFLEWNFLCYAGKVSFSIYMLHMFVIHDRTVERIGNKYDKFFVNFTGTMLLATAGYWAVEYPSQLMAQRISKALTRIGSGSTPPPKP